MGAVLKRRTSAEFGERARDLVRDEKVQVSGTEVIAASPNIIPMVLHRSSRFTVVGDLTLAMVMLAIARFVVTSFLVIFFCSVLASGLLYWFSFRAYYDLRTFHSERLILLPPNAGDNVLLHELLHVHLGHIKPMDLSKRILAMTPLGPFLFWRRAVHIESEVTKEMTRRGWKNPGPVDFFRSPPLGIIPLTVFMIVGSLILIILLLLSIVG